MNLDEVFDHKRHMENKIHDAVIEFETYTGLRVSSVGLERLVVECTRKDGLEMVRANRGVKVSTEVKL